MVILGRVDEAQYEELVAQIILSLRSGLTSI